MQDLLVAKQVEATINAKLSQQLTQQQQQQPQPLWEWDPDCVYVCATCPAGVAAGQAALEGEKRRRAFVLKLAFGALLLAQVRHFTRVRVCVCCLSVCLSVCVSVCL